MTNITIQTVTETSSIADIAEAYNQLKGTETDAKTLAKRGKAKLVSQIQAMMAEQDLSGSVSETTTPEEAKPNGINHFVSQLTASTSSKTSKAPKTAKAKPASPEVVSKEKKEKGPSIRSVAEELLLVVDSFDEDKRPYGLTYEAVLNAIRNQFAGAKTTVACLRWYAVHMRERGESVPHRPRATPAVAAPAGE